MISLIANRIALVGLLSLLSVSFWVSCTGPIPLLGENNSSKDAGSTDKVSTCPTTCKENNDCTTCPGKPQCESGVCAAATLKSECKEDKECKPDQRCFLGICTARPAGCRSDKDCKADELCVQTQDGTKCEKGCKEDKDCAQGQLCNAGRCQITCKSNADCAMGEQCQQGKCLSNRGPQPGQPCTEDKDCTDGMKCITLGPQKICAPDGAGETCKVNTDCKKGLSCNDTPRGMICVPAQGPPPCQSAAECRPGDQCVQGRCQGPGGQCPARCRADNECTSCPNQRTTCVQGQCAAPPQNQCPSTCKENADCASCPDNRTSCQVFSGTGVCVPPQNQCPATCKENADCAACPANQQLCKDTKCTQ